jgi:hypothetical protein
MNEAIVIDGVWFHTTMALSSSNQIAPIERGIFQM